MTTSSLVTTIMASYVEPNLIWNKSLDSKLQSERVAGSRDVFTSNGNHVLKNAVKFCCF